MIVLLHPVYCDVQAAGSWRLSKGAVLTIKRVTWSTSRFVTSSGNRKSNIVPPTAVQRRQYIRLLCSSNSSRPSVSSSSSNTHDTARQISATSIRGGKVSKDV